MSLIERYRPSAAIARATAERPVPPGRSPVDVPRPVPPGAEPAEPAEPVEGAPPADTVGGSYPSEEPGFGDVLSRLFTPPDPVVVPTPYGDSYGAPGGSPALLGVLAVAALGGGAWYLWKRGRS